MCTIVKGGEKVKIKRKRDSESEEESERKEAKKHEVLERDERRKVRANGVER